MYPPAPHSPHPDVPPTSTTRSRFAHDRLLTALRVVESLPPTAQGALLVGTADEAHGTILVDKNRVCWSAAPGMSQRFRDILRSHSSIPPRPDDLDSICDRCRREHRALDAELVVSGMLTEDHLRDTLKQHTIESLLAVDLSVASSFGEWPMRWVEHAGAGYNPRHTFSPLELLAAAGAQRLPGAAALATEAHLDHLAGPQTALIACSFLPNGTPLYLTTPSSVPLDLQDVVELASWAEAALGASQGFSPAVARACVQAADGGGAVAWRHHDQRCAALCVDGLSLKRLTDTLSQRNQPMVLVTRCTVLDRARQRLGLTHRA